MIWIQLVKPSVAAVAALATSVWATPTGSRITQRDTDKYVFAHFMVECFALILW